MRILTTSGLLFLCAAGAMACGDASSSSGVGTGGTGGAMGTGTGTGGQPQVLGTQCSDFPEDCCNAWAEACYAEGGYTEGCMFGENCTTSKYPVGVASECYPVTKPTTGQFACAYLACNVGQVCNEVDPLGDGCSSHQCVSAPAPCQNTPTCACFMANGLMGVECSSDAAGNATVRSFGPWH